MPRGDVAADVAAPGEAHEGGTLDHERVEERRDEVRERMRVVARSIESGRAAESGRVEREDSEAVAAGERRAGSAERRGTATRTKTDAVPVEDRSARQLAPDPEGQPGAARLDPALGAEIHRP